jgi:AcrR family transcriptional regulator
MLSRDPRDRILAAMVEIVAKRGYQKTTVEHIVKRAGVSRATFYQFFENREGCLLAALAEAERGLQRRVSEATKSGEWTARICTAATVFVDQCAAEPAVARTCLVEVMTAGPVAMERYERALTGFVPLLREGRECLEGTGELPDDLEEMIIGGIVWMVHERLVRNEIDAISGLLPAMLELALLPYLGEEGAAQVIAAAAYRPSPRRLHVGRRWSISQG